MVHKRSCVYAGCGNFSSSTRKNVHVYTFPADLERRRQWIERSGNVSRGADIEKYYTGRFLCELHFDDSQFHDARRTKLIRTALPRPYVPVQAAVGVAAVLPSSSVQLDRKNATGKEVGETSTSNSRKRPLQGDSQTAELHPCCKTPCIQLSNEALREAAKEVGSVSKVAEEGRPLSQGEEHRSPSEVAQDYRLHSGEERGMKVFIPQNCFWSYR